MRLTLSRDGSVFEGEGDPKEWAELHALLTEKTVGRKLPKDHDSVIEINVPEIAIKNGSGVHIQNGRKRMPSNINKLIRVLDVIVEANGVPVEYPELKEKAGIKSPADMGQVNAGWKRFGAAVGIPVEEFVTLSAIPGFPRSYATAPRSKEVLALMGGQAELEVY